MRIDNYSGRKNCVTLIDDKIPKCDFVSGLQMTDVELDARVSALEENGGNSKPYSH